MRVCPGVNQLRVTRTRFPARLHASFQNVRNAELLGDLPQVLGVLVMCIDVRE